MRTGAGKDKIQISLLSVKGRRGKQLQIMKNAFRIGDYMSEKKMMLGNAAIARGVWEAGVKVSSAYPGTPSTEISEELYNDMLNVMPPIYLRKSPYCGFQVGEPYCHREDAKGRWRAKFMTFVHIGERFFYAGIHFGGECEWRLET